MKLPLVSPGWTLPVIITHGLYAISSGSDSKLVMINPSKSLPANVCPSRIFQILSDVFELI